MDNNKTTTTTLDVHIASLPPQRQEAIINRAKALSMSIELKKLRKANNLKKSELADKMGVFKSTVSEIEQGDEVSISLLQDYIQALGGELMIVAKMPDREVALI